jgi:ribosomal protein L11 methyltransferase
MLAPVGWNNVEFFLDAESADRLGDALLAHGAVSVTVSDAQAGAFGEEAIFGEPGELLGLWRECKLAALLDEGAAVAEIVAAALETADLPPGTNYALQSVAEQDWVQVSKAQFKPLQTTPRLWVVPTWHTPPDPGAINLMLDPGLAFGTGSHPTTRLCLNWLEQNIRGGETVLDYGCGSGVLAIAAAKLGASAVYGVDIDPVALTVAASNAVVNGVRAHFTSPDNLPKMTADLVVANILANPLKLLAPILIGATRPGGRLALAGLLTSQAREVAACYATAIGLEVVAEDSDWVCLAGIKGGA